MKKILLGTVLLCALQPTFAQSGQLDPSFGIKGIVKTDMGAPYNYSSSARQVFIRPDSSIYIVLDATFITKRLPNGSIDSTYGINGYSRAVSLTNASAAFESDGKIVIAGSGSNNSSGLARINSNGKTDSAFGNNGLQVLGLTPNSVAIQSDGKIIVAGYTTNSDNETFFAVARYNTNGTLDDTFNGSGQVVTDFVFYLPPDTEGGDSVEIHNAYANSVAIQADGKIVAGGYAATKNNYDFAIARYNTDGIIDSTFGKNGKVNSDFTTSDDEGNALAIEADGKIVLAGYTKSSSQTHFAVARYKSDGSLDDTFGTDGKEKLNLNVDGSIKNSVVIQNDNKIVVAGDALNGSLRDFVVARFNEDGSADNSFDNDGKLTTDFNSSDDYAGAVALQPDGKIVVAGYEYIYPSTGNSSQENFVLARYNTDGGLDNSFDKDGKLEGNYKQGFTVFNSTAVQADGKIVAAGFTWSGSYYDFAVARFNNDGSPDSSFSSDGKQITHFDTTAYATSVALQSDGKIVVAGTYNSQFAVVRYNTDGTLDNSFSGDGKVMIPMDFADILNSVAIQNDGKIILAGFSYTGPNLDSTNFAVARLNSDGSPDNSFSNDGKQLTNFGSAYNFASSAAIQADGKIVIAGRSIQSGSSNFALARYNIDGSLDTSFSNDGKQTNVFGTGTDDYFCNALTIQKNGGKIVLGGYSETVSGSGSAFVVARYLSNGNVDNTFSDDGFQSTDLSTEFEYGRSLAINSDGKIALGGTNDNYALVLYNNDGSFDNSFSKDGIQTTNIGTGGSSIESIVFADDKLYAAGYSEFPGSLGVVARYLLSQGGPLPVSLLNFKAVLQNNSAVVLKWEIATEKNLTSFIIERSADGNGFLPINNVATNGVSTFTQDYMAVDEHPLQDINFYRLKMVDINGQFTYSNIVAVKITANSKLQLFPNPVKDILYVQASGNNENATIQIIDAAGRKMKDFQVVLNKNTSFSIGVNNLPAGIYNLILRKKNNTEAQTFIRR